jgi:hypothetical protein
MPADSPVFERTCQELEQRTNLDRLEVRGTVRIGLKAAGLDGYSVDAAQMVVILRKVLPTELEIRGIGDTAAVCEEVVTAIEGIAFEAPADRAGAAAATMSRFGG